MRGRGLGDTEPTPALHVDYQRADHPKGTIPPKDLESIQQDQFIELLGAAIAYLRQDVAWRIIDGQAPRDAAQKAFKARLRGSTTEVSVNATFRWRRADGSAPWPTDEVPQILFEVTRAFQSLDRRKCDITHWYYEELTEHYGIRSGDYPDHEFQRRVRLFLQNLHRLSEPPRDRPSPDLPPDQEAAAPEDFESTLGRVDMGEAALQEYTKQMGRQLGRDLPDDSLLKLRNGLLEVLYTLGMIDWIHRPEGKRGLYVVRLPEPEVITAKVFGLKTAIAGFDDLVGGGIVLRSSPTLDASRRLVDKPGLIGIIRGRFGTGKSTLAAQLAFEMARKGGAGVLMVLEQSVSEVLTQAYHYGWMPSSRPFKLFGDREIEPRASADRWPGVERRSSLPPREEFLRFVSRSTKKRGALYIAHPEDASMANFERELDDITSFASAPSRADFPFRFVVVDPIDAVQLSARDAAQPGPSQRVRNRTEQILREVSARGVTVWLTTDEQDSASRPAPYWFLPNIADVVIHLSTLAAGGLITDIPLRLFELEKVRTQRFARGVHPFDIRSGDGIHIYPSAEGVTGFVTWADNSLPSKDADAPLSLGIAALDLALGTGGVRPRSITTLMGPTGCAKTELALLYLLHGWKERDPSDRSLYLAFRDTWQSIDVILDGPVGEQLGYKPTNKDDRDLLRRILDVLPIRVGNVPSGAIFERIRNAFKTQPHGTHYRRVVIDNVAYMDLTSPLVRQDELFVPTLLQLLQREHVTPVFITSLVEGVVSESRVQTQIRDASNNLVMLKRQRHEAHHFIAMQIQKSERLLHEPQPLEVCVGEAEGSGLRFFEDPENVRQQILRFLCGPRVAPTPQRFSQNVDERDLRIGLARLDEIERALHARVPDDDVQGGLGAMDSMEHQVTGIDPRTTRGTVVYAEELRSRMKQFRSFMEKPVPAEDPKEEPVPSELAEDPKGKGRSATRAGNPEGYKLRAVIADLLHRYYVVLCQNMRQPVYTSRPPLSETDPAMLEWRGLYRTLMDVIEQQRGLYVRLHTLDDYYALDATRFEVTGPSRAIDQHAGGAR